MTEINTNSGKVKGFLENEVKVFKSIPYAEPPVGGLRFRPPVAIKSWDGTYEAIEYKLCAYQGYTQLEEWFGKLQPESEDCLNLSIWSPESDGEKLPVMCWFHGGAFIMGGGVDPLYTGISLAKRGKVVVVTVNYRLGALGFLYIPGETANVGLLDQIAALEWIKRNIEYFNGDPNNITIFGESAGAYSVMTLPTVPKAKGLINRVIAESFPFFDPETSEKSTKGLMRMLKVRGDLDAFRKIPPEKIIEAQNSYMEKDPTNILAFRPMIDGDVIPKHPLKAYENGECSDIDLMIGTNFHEAKLFTALEPNLKKMIETGGETALINYLGTLKIGSGKAKEIVETYKSARAGTLPTDDQEIFDAMLTDIMFRVPTIRFLEAQSKHNKNTYNYIFTYESPLSGGILRSSHAVELPFVFNTLDLEGMGDFVGKGPIEQELSERIMDAWTSFAHKGNPNHDNLPEWLPYDVDQRITMFLGKECKIVNAALDKERQAWDGLLEV